MPYSNSGSTSKKIEPPLIERILEDVGFSLVTFVWEGASDTKNVVVVGGPAGVDPVANQLNVVPGTNIWYKSYRIRNDARFSYALSPNDNLHPILEINPADGVALAKRASNFKSDPLNPTRTLDMLSSFAELPEAPPQPWIRFRSNVPHGTVVSQKFKSTILNNERDIWVYTPPDFNADREGRYPLLLVFDGKGYTAEIPVPNIH
jgi:hypothetical protein